MANSKQNKGQVVQTTLALFRDKPPIVVQPTDTERLENDPEGFQKDQEEMIRKNLRNLGSSLVTRSGEWVYKLKQGASYPYNSSYPIVIPD
jgi:hypothetical protein